MIMNEAFSLCNDTNVPKLGLGTWFIDDAHAAEVVRQAVAAGYRHVDTAQAYGNERGVGEGIRSCGIDRERLFVTSKIAAETKTYASATKAIDDILATMGLDYLDLVLIHSPQPWAEFRDPSRRCYRENVQTWHALEDAYASGKVRAIGVSNFLEDDLDNLLENCIVRPMVDQVLCHVGNTPSDLIGFCQRQRIQVEAYSPIAHGAVLANPGVKAIADRYLVTVAQLCIRYVLQLGCVALPKTADPDHLRSNTQIDFAISNRDMDALSNVSDARDYGEFSAFPVFSGR